MTTISGQSDIEWLPGLDVLRTVNLELPRRFNAPFVGREAPKWRPQRDKVTTPLLILDDVQAERIQELAQLVA